MLGSYSGSIIEKLFPDGLDGLYDIHIKADEDFRFIIQLIGRERDDGSSFAYYTGDDFTIVIVEAPHQKGAIVHRLGHGNYEGKYTQLPTDTVLVDSFEEAKDEVKAYIGGLAL